MHGLLIEAQSGFPVRYANKTQKAKQVRVHKARQAELFFDLTAPFLTQFPDGLGKKKAKNQRWHVNESVVHKVPVVDHDVGYYGKCDQVKGYKP